eukprot:GHVH01014275.1.p1 GENE.GHVH01014275.1~~GHVH01014275.1.p1  ORF type:complete len:120 (+),score=7.63 GHVH01014275.1:28-360(+)
MFTYLFRATLVIMSAYSFKALDNVGEPPKFEVGNKLSNVLTLKFKNVLKVDFLNWAEFMAFTQDALNEDLVIPDNLNFACEIEGSLDLGHVLGYHRNAPLWSFLFIKSII